MLSIILKVLLMILIFVGSFLIFGLTDKLAEKIYIFIQKKIEQHRKNKE